MPNNNPDTPLITIGITCYDAADTIKRAIDSAAAQDWDNKEIIIVDDCSTDNTVEIIKETIANIPYAKLIQHKVNQRTPASRNTVVSNSTGEFIAYFDDDDESDPKRISTQYKRIKQYEAEIGSDLIACYASGHRQYSNGYQFPLHAIGSQLQAPHGEKLIDYVLFYKKQPGWFYGSGTPTCSLMLTRNTIETIGGFDTGFRRLEDVDFAIRLALLGGHFIGCPEHLLIQHSTITPDKSPEVNLKVEQELARKYKDYLDKVNYFYYALIWPEIRFYHYKKQYFKMAFKFLSLLVRHPIKASSHILSTAPRRLIHEWKMSKKKHKGS